MTALPISANESAVRAAVERLSHVQPGAYQVVSCYLKLEPRDKTRGKYLIKIKNRIREALAALERQVLDRALRAQVAADLERVQAYFAEPTRLPPARGIALFACGALDLFEALPLPHVHRSRLAVAPVPLVRELVALEEEFGTILVAACDRTSARFFEVTAYDVVELPSLTAEATRPGKFHGERQAKRGHMLAGGFGEHNYHMRIREERQRHYAQVADRIFQVHTQRPLAGLVVAGIGVDAAALLPHLHTYLHDLVLGVVRLNPKRVTATEVREAALSLREERERAWERAHAEAVREGIGTGWAVNGIEPTLKAHLARRRAGRRPAHRRCHRGGPGPARPGRRRVRRAGAPRRGRARRPAAVPSLMPGSKRPIRVLVAKPGLDGHDRGAKVVAAALRDAGMEVIYTGLHQTPEMIAQAAIQEDVDVVGLSILSGAHLTLFPRVKQLLVAAGRDDVLVTGGGIIPPADMEALQQQGIGKLFGPGTPTSDLVRYIEEWAAEHVSA